MANLRMLGLSDGIDLLRIAALKASTEAERDSFSASADYLQAKLDGYRSRRRVEADDLPTVN
jgi:hypothetical protein